MCCNNHQNHSSCGCDRMARCGGCGCGCGDNRMMRRCDCGCGDDRMMRRCDCGCGDAVTLPAFPDWPACGCQSEREMEFPVYVSIPATMTRGNANFSASVEREEPCGCARG